MNAGSVPTPEVQGYVELKRVGSGGFSTVFSARERSTGATVAVKVVHLAGRVPGEARAAVRLEAEAMAAVGDSPHATRLVAQMETAASEPCLITTLHPKGTLHDRIVVGGALAASEAIWIGESIGRCIETLHNNGFVHGDLKARNVMFDDGGEPVLIDFGSAERLDVESSEGAAPVVAQSHVAPELLSGARPSIRSDIYALAALIWSAHTAADPFGASLDAPESERSWENRLVQIRTAAPVLPTGSAVSHPLLHNLAGALSKAPTDRPATVDPLLVQLAALSPHPYHN